MKINKIEIANFANIGTISLDLADINALVAPNNYGKSNVLRAIQFAAEFIEATPKTKESMMQMDFAPLNKITHAHDFTFRICGESFDSKAFDYSFAFKWGCGITEERLSFKNASSQRFIKLIDRQAGDVAKFMPTPESRCVKILEVGVNNLALNKLSNFDNLFFIGLLREIGSVDIRVIDTLVNPDNFFIRSGKSGSKHDYSTAFPATSSAAFFIYSLKMTCPDRYALLCDAVRQLLPNIEEIEATEVCLDGYSNDRLYDIRIKECNNISSTSISSISSGSKKIVYLLALTIAAEINKIPLITFEELENSVHPRLLEALLLIIRSLAGDTKVLTTSHSPYLIKYLNPSQIYLGMPSSDSLADFRKIKEGKIRKLLRLASAEEISIGEYLFELMLDIRDDEELLNEYFK